MQAVVEKYGLDRRLSGFLVMADDILISPKHITSRDQTKVWADTVDKPQVYDVIKGS